MITNGARRERIGLQAVQSSRSLRGDHMSDRHARYGAATGILFVLFVIVGFLVTPNPPAADASAAEVFEYVRDKQDTLHTVQLLFAAAGFFFIWFLGTLRHTLAAAEGRDG